MKNLKFSLSLHPLSLKFGDAAQEKLFLEDYAHQVLPLVRAGMMLAMLMYSAFALLDYWVMREFVYQLWGTRLTVLSICLPIFIFSFSEKFREHNQRSQIIFVIVAVGGLLAMVAVISLEHGYNYYVGLILGSVFTYNFVGLRIRQALILNLLTIFCYNVIVTFKGIPGWIQVNNNFFLIGVSTIAAGSAYMMERQRRITFFQTVLLAELKEKADAANAAKSRFFASMSHELRTPLNAIIGYSEMLLEDAKDSEKKGNAQDLKSIETAGRHLLRLINDVLDLGKIEAGKIELVKESVSVAELVKRIESTAKPLVSINNNNLLIDISKAPESLYTDSMRLDQILINLLSNACKFTKNGDITLKVIKSGEMVEFVVRDSGIGMTEDQIEVLFDEYSQADATTSRNYGGTGLGLTITKQLIELLDGNILVKSQPERGSEFIVTLPLMMKDR